MTHPTADTSQRNAAKIAGLMYVFIILLGVLKISFLEPALIVPGDASAPVSANGSSELLFRIGIVSETTMYVLVIFLSLALYIILKPVNRNLALAALFLRFGEGIIGAVITVISGLIPLLLINGAAGIETVQLQALGLIFQNVRIAGLDIVLIFIGLGGTIFCYLFFISKYVPRLLAAWGIFTYLSMLILALISILFPDHPVIIETVLYASGGLFELIFGLWLLFKGVNIPRAE